MVCDAPSLAGEVPPSVPFERRDLGLLAEGLGGVVIPAIIGGDIVACTLQRPADGGADAARSSRDESYPSHECLPLVTFNAGARRGYPRGLIAVEGRSIPLDAHGDGHAAADAERGKTLLGIALLHLVQQRDEHACAGSTDRMADGDGAAIDVDLAGVPGEVLVHCQGLCGESLIGLDQVEIADVPASFLQGFARSGDRPRPHDLGINRSEERRVGKEWGTGGWAALSTETRDDRQA